MRTRNQEEEIPASAAAKASFLGEGTETHLDPAMRPPETIPGPRSALVQEVVAEAIVGEAPPEPPVEGEKPPGPDQGLPEPEEPPMVDNTLPEEKPPLGGG